MKRFFCGVVVVLMMGGTASAWALSKGESMLAVGLGNTEGSFVNPLRTAGYLSQDTGDPSDQIVVQGEYWYLFSDDYAVNVSYGYGFNSMKAEPRSTAPANSPDQKFSSSSFMVRVGGDRVGQVGERFTLFMGPGVEFWSGKTEFEDVYGTTPPDNDVESETVTRWGLSGRIGGVMKLSNAVGLVGHIGHGIAYASAEESGSKLTWWDSGFRAFGGVVLTFGGYAQ